MKLIHTLRHEHKVGMVVPKGGSSCSTCKYLRGGTDCVNAGWVDVHRVNGGGGGNTAIPAPADSYCCDQYETSAQVG